jgi:2C-methyl-D-erythritol 2,4-cyclodiphosphate synthase
MFVNLHAITKNDKALDENKDKLLKLYYPDLKDSKMSLMEEAAKMVETTKTDTMKMGVMGNKEIAASAASLLLNKAK